MTLFVDDPDFRLYVGDVREQLALLPDASVDCVVTSPPYFGLRDYGSEGQIGLEATPQEYVQTMVDVFREIHRVLAPHGTAWLNLGDSYAANRSYQVRDNKHTDVGNTMAASVPDGLKSKDLMGIPWRVAFALQDDGWYLRSDVVWCLSGGARVYARTQKGEAPMTVKDLVRLDPETVSLWNGERWTRVRGFYPSPTREGGIEIELRSGEAIGCTPGHVWPTQRGNVRADDLRIGDVIATTRLPEAPDAGVGIALGTDVAWMVGLYLAEGSMSGDTVQFAVAASEAEEVSRRIEGVARRFHGTVTLYTDGAKAIVGAHGPMMAPLIRSYIHGMDARTKGLKPRCWARGNDWLAAMLDGYLFGDGHRDEKNQRWRLGFARNDRLAADLRTLSARLGLTLTLRKSWATGFGKRWPTYRGEIRHYRSGHHNERDRGEVVALRASRARRYWDIEVEDEPHLFALASGVLTHNSKPNPMPESVVDRPTKSHEYVFLLTKAPSYYFDQEAVREPFTTTHAPGSAIRPTQHYGAENGGNGGLTGHLADVKARLRDASRPQAETLDGSEGEAPRGPDGRRQTGVQGREGSVQHRDGERWPNEGRNIRSVWTITTQPYSEAHFATFPEELPRRCILAGCPEWVCRTCGKPRQRLLERGQSDYARLKGDRDWRDLQEAQAHRGSSGASCHTLTPGGVTPSLRPRTAETLGWSDCGHGDYRAGVVLDPFMGAGTTALVARKLARHSVGIELNPEYADLIARRLHQLSLFA